MLIDLDLQFGGIAFMLGLKAKKTIADLTDTGALRGYDDVKQCLVKHSSGFDLLPAPTKPEQSESVDSNHVRKIVTCSKDQYDYIIIDTHSLLQEISINALDLSDLIMNGHISLNGLKSVEGLEFPNSLSGNVELNGLIRCSDLRLPKKLNGSLYLKKLEYAEGLQLPDEINGNLDLSGLKIYNGLVLPTKIHIV